MEGQGIRDKGKEGLPHPQPLSETERGAEGVTLSPSHPLTPSSPDTRSLRRKLHQTIRKVGEDIENFRFNTCVAALMELTNELSAFRNALGNSAPTEEQALLLSEVLETMTLLLSPITPHLADEFWERLEKVGFTFREPWPQFDPEVAQEDAITIVIQVN